MKFDVLCEIYLDRYLYPSLGQMKDKKKFKKLLKGPSGFRANTPEEPLNINLNGWELTKQNIKVGNAPNRQHDTIRATKDGQVGVELNINPYGLQNEYSVSHVQKYRSDAPSVPEIYRQLITKLKIVLHADRHQSVGGMNIWKKLMTYPDIDMYYLNTNENSDRKWKLLNTKDPSKVGMLWGDREGSPLANIRLKAIAKG